MNNRQKKMHQAGIFVNCPQRLPTEQEYGIPIIANLTPYEQVNGSSSHKDDFEEAQSVEMQTQQKPSYFQGRIDSAQHVDGSLSQNKLPESVFAQMNKQLVDLTGLAREKHQPPWKQIREQRRSSNNTQRKQESTPSAYQQTGKVLNASLDRNSAYGSSGRSPYQKMASTVQERPLHSLNCVQSSTEAIKLATRSSLAKVMNHSQSIENERNRIYDVVNNINGASNVLITRTESTNSPMFRPSHEMSSFGSPNHSKTVACRGHNPNAVASVYQRSEDVEAQNGTGTTTLKAGLTQSSSQKGIHQIPAILGVASQQTQSGTKNTTRSLYQSKPNNNNKYNFITPMILSDLHQISATQQARPSEEPRHETDKLVSPSGTHSKQQIKARRENTNNAVHIAPASSVGMDAKLNQIRTGQMTQIETPHLNGRGDTFQSMTTQGLHNRGQERANNPAQGVFQNMRPQSDQRPGGSNLPGRTVSIGPSNVHSQNNTMPPPSFQKRRHLKTPAVLSTQVQEHEQTQEQPIQSQPERRKLQLSKRQATDSAQARLEEVISTPHTFKEAKAEFAANRVKATGLGQDAASLSASSEPSFEQDQASSKERLSSEGRKTGTQLNDSAATNLQSKLQRGESEKRTPEMRSQIKSRNGKKSTQKKQKCKLQITKQEESVNPMLQDLSAHQQADSDHQFQVFKLPDSSLAAASVCDARSNKRSDIQQQSEDVNWSVQSMNSSQQSAYARLTDHLPDLAREQEYTQKPKQSKVDEQAVTIEESRIEVEVSGEGKRSDYFNEQILVVFNRIALERDRMSEDPVQFAEQKVQGFLVRNPLNQRFIQKTKGLLPKSVFKPHANQVTFLKSIFEGRPPVAFFQYPSYVGIKRVADRIRMYTREEVEHLFMSFRISDSAHIYNAVVNSCKSAGFTMLESNNTHLFNLQWTGYIGVNDIKHLNKYQKTNHFPGSIQLGRKDLLWRNFSRMRSKFPKDFVITPLSYLIQEDYDAFLAERERDPNALWILKPVAASCGRGIKIINSTQRINKKEGYLAAKYIDNPHLLNGLKYDMRVYALVTSFNPLRIYMYNDGLVRFATEKYSNDPRKLQKKFVHLTNFAINKKNTNFVKNNDQFVMGKLQGQQSAHGGQVDEDQMEFDQNTSKWDFRMLRMAYEDKGINYEYVIAQFKDLIVKTLLCVEPIITQNLQKNPTSRVNCFELYGFDILVDSNHKPWVLEVNVLPSLSSSSPFDKRIKTQLICDTLTLVGIRGYDKQKFHSQTTELLGLAPFSQSMTLSELRQKPRLTGQEKLTKDELEMLMDMDEEFMRRGNFQRIFPLASNASFYEQFFETKRYQNALCAAYLTSPQHIRDQLLHKYRRVYNSQV